MTKPFTTYSLVLFFAAVVVAFGALMITVPQLGLPESVTSLLAFMAAIAVLTIGLAYIAYRLRLVRWFGSLRWALLGVMFLTVALIFVNVWVTAHLMFIKESDLAAIATLLAFAGVTALVFGYFVSRALTDSISELAKGAEQLARGKLDTRLNVYGNDELAEFARTFNWMASCLQEVDEQKQQLDQQRRDLIAWASHDLRTPVTSMRAMIEAMIDGVISDPQTTERYLHNMQQESQRLTKLIDNLFELAQLDAGHLKLNYQKVSLRDLISDTLGSMTARAEYQGIQLSGEVETGVDLVDIAPDKIQRVLNNLLDNAIRYTPAGGKVVLKASLEGEYVKVVVHNSGSGMVGIDLSQVFTRFYREERSRAQSKDGHRGAGLGLAITRGFVEAHGGKIWVESDPVQGVTFTFTLPRTAPRHTPYKLVSG